MASPLNTTIATRSFLRLPRKSFTTRLTASIFDEPPKPRSDMDPEVSMTRTTSMPSDTDSTDARTIWGRASARMKSTSAATRRATRIQRIRTRIPGRDTGSRPSDEKSSPAPGRRPRTTLKAIPAITTASSARSQGS